MIRPATGTDNQIGIDLIGDPIKMGLRDMFQIPDKIGYLPENGIFTISVGDHLPTPLDVGIIRGGPERHNHNQPGNDKKGRKSAGQVHHGFTIDIFKIGQN